MGTVCCTDRRVKSLQLDSPSKKKSKSKIEEIKTLSPAKSERRKTKLSVFNDSQFRTSKPDSQVLQKNSAGLDENESLIEELEYDLIEANDLEVSDQQNIVTILELFKHDVPTDEQEGFEGLDYVKMYESETYCEDRALLISSHAMYLLRKDDLKYVHRRVRIENIQILLMNSELTEIIFHMVNGELLGDVWVSSNNIENIHNCIQTMFKYLTRRYIPVAVLSGKLFKNKFNSFPQSLVHSLTNDDNLRANDIVIQEGKIGEVILFNKKAKTVINGNLNDCVCVLTSKAIYCITLDYIFVNRLDIKAIKTLKVSENIDKIVIEKNNGDKILWFLNLKFISELEKAILSLKKERLNIVNKAEINVDTFLTEKQKKLKRT